MIESVSGATSVLALYRKPKPAAEGLEEPKAPEPRASVPAPVTGGSAPAIAPETAGALIEKGQGVAEDEFAGLPVALRHWMEDLVNEPDYAAKQAEFRATHQTACWMSPSEMPKNGDPAEVWTAFTLKMEGRAAQAREVQEKRYQVYQDEIAKGTPPAEIFAAMLKSDLSQSSSYWDAVGGTKALETTRTQLAYLEKLLAQASA